MFCLPKTAWPPTSSVPDQPRIGGDGRRGNTLKPDPRRGAGSVGGGTHPPSWRLGLAHWPLSKGHGRVETRDTDLDGRHEAKGAGETSAMIGTGISWRQEVISTDLTDLRSLFGGPRNPPGDLGRGR